MLDIVFIMLIFFIVTATFVRESGIDLIRPPEAQSNKKSTEASVLIRISDSGTVYYGAEERPIGAKQVRPNVERFMAENPRGGVIVSVSRKAKTQVLVDVVDQVRLGGATPVVVEGGA